MPMPPLSESAKKTIETAVVTSTEDVNKQKKLIKTLEWAAKVIAAGNASIVYCTALKVDVTNIHSLVIKKDPVLAKKFADLFGEIIKST